MSDWNIVSLLETATSSSSSDPIVTALVTSLRSPDALTENGAPAFSTTDSAVLDLFGKLTRDLSEDELHRLFDLSWKENPVRLVQLIHYTRDCRGALGEKRLFYLMALRLRQLYPLTYLRNLKAFIEAGYFKDLLVLLETLEKAKAPKLAQDDFVELLVFKQQLLEDERVLSEGGKNISLAGKWAPSVGKHFGGIAKRLAKLIYKKDPEIHKKYRQLLSKLRAHLQVVEIPMCAGKWETVKYEAVPARAMKIYADAFKTHDEERYAEFLGKVKTGEKKINTTGLQPHELTKKYMGYEPKYDETVEMQWKTLVEKLREDQNLKNTLAVVDVSGSMAGVPMEVAIALGLVCSELTDGPFHNVVCTFEDQPSLATLPSGPAVTLLDKFKVVSRLPWGGSTNFEAVFDLILTKYREEKLRKEDLPETVICFTDMQFNEASTKKHGDIGTLYDVVKAKFTKLDLPTPRFVFWNLRASLSAFPIKMDTPNTALVSGYSAEILKLFMAGGDFDPLVIIKKAFEGRPAAVDPSEAPKRF